MNQIDEILRSSLNMLNMSNNDEEDRSNKTNATTKKIESALLNDQDFQKGMGSIVDDKQMKTMETYIPK